MNYIGKNDLMAIKDQKAQSWSLYILIPQIL